MCAINDTDRSVPNFIHLKMTAIWIVAPKQVTPKLQGLLVMVRRPLDFAQMIVNCTSIVQSLSTQYRRGRPRIGLGPFLPYFHQWWSAAADLREE